MKIQLFNTLEVYKNIFPTDANNREINIYKINNAISTGHNLYYPNVLFKTENNLVLPLLERTMSLKSGTIYEKDNMVFNYCEKAIKTHYEEPIFFFIYNTDNYFHFIYDSLPYLISYLQVKKEIPNLKLLIQYPNEQKKDIYPFVLEFLEILNINKTDIVLLDEFTEYKEIYISTSYTHDFNSNLHPREEIYNFYQDIVKNGSRAYLRIRY